MNNDNKKNHILFGDNFIINIFDQPSFPLYFLLLLQPYPCPFPIAKLIKYAKNNNELKMP